MLKGGLIMSETEHTPEPSAEQLTAVKQDDPPGDAGGGQGQEQAWPNYWRTVSAIT
jgi:hypothetical protein